MLPNLQVHRNLQCVLRILVRAPYGQSALASMGRFILSYNLRQVASEIIRFQPERVLCFNLLGLGVAGLFQYLVAVGHRPIAFLMDNILHEIASDPHSRAAFARVFGPEAWLDKVEWVFISRNLLREVETMLNRSLPCPKFIPGWFDRSPLRVDALRLNLERAEQGGVPTRFIFCSRIAPHKGINLIIEAARSLLEQGHENFELDVYGAGDVAQMLQSIAAQRLQDHVRYRGCLPKEEMLLRFGAYDALLFPTLPREPFGFVACEAAAAACIPVMTAGIGASEWFLDGVDCLKIRNDAEGLSAAMLKLMFMPVREILTMRRRTQATAFRFFTWARALDQLDDALAAVHEGHDGPPSVTARAARAVEAAMSVLTEVWWDGEKNPEVEWLQSQRAK